MDEKMRMEYLRRMQEGMRAMTEAEIADMQRRQVPLMRNAADQMCGQSGMQNFLTIDEAHGIPVPQKPTFWQRLKRLFVMHN